MRVTSDDLMTIRQRAVIAEARAFYPPEGRCGPRGEVCTCKLADALDAYDRARVGLESTCRWLMTTEGFERASYAVTRDAVNDAIVSSFWRGVCAERARALESFSDESGCLDESCRAASLAVDHRAWAGAS